MNSHSDVDSIAYHLSRYVFFFLGIELQLSANEDYLEADRIENFNPPWARFLRRRADRKRAKARKLAPNVYDGEVV
jgi:hypothetical protein